MLCFWNRFFSVWFGLFGDVCICLLFVWVCVVSCVLCSSVFGIVLVFFVLVGVNMNVLCYFGRCYIFCLFYVSVVFGCGVLVLLLVGLLLLFVF